MKQRIEAHSEQIPKAYVRINDMVIKDNTLVMLPNVSLLVLYDICRDKKGRFPFLYCALTHSLRQCQVKN